MEMSTLRHTLIFANRLLPISAHLIETEKPQRVQHKETATGTITNIQKCASDNINSNILA